MKSRNSEPRDSAGLADERGVARTADPVESNMRQRWWEAMPADLSKQCKPRVTRVGGALVTLMKESTSKSMNVVLCLGVTERAKESMIDEILDFAKAARAKRLSFHLSPCAQSAAIERWLFERGFKPHGRHVKHLRSTDTPARAETELTVRRITREHATAFGEIVCKNFGWPQSRAGWLASLVGQKDFHHYMAFSGEAPVATGLLYAEGEHGYLAWGATLTPYRRRGAQGTLIAARVTRAAKLGLKWLTAETFEPARGRPAGSYRNFLRQGFRPAYLRPVYVWEEPQDV